MERNFKIFIFQNFMGNSSRQARTHSADFGTVQLGVFESFLQKLWMLKVRFSSYKPLLQKKSLHLVWGGIRHVLPPIFNWRILWRNSPAKHTYNHTGSRTPPFKRFQLTQSTRGGEEESEIQTNGILIRNHLMMAYSRIGQDCEGQG